MFFIVLKLTLVDISEGESENTFAFSVPIDELTLVPFVSTEEIISPVAVSLP